MQCQSNPNQEIRKIDLKSFEDKVFHHAGIRSDQLAEDRQNVASNH